MASTTFTYTILTGSVSTSGSIRNWAQHASIPAEQILEASQQWIYQRLRADEMTVEEEITIAVDEYTMAIPSGFIAPVYLLLDGDTRPLDYVEENLLQRYVDPDGVVTTGRPQRWTLFNNLVQFDCANDDDAALAGDFVFYKYPDFLTATTNETNFLTDKFGMLLMDVCVAHAYKHRKRPEGNAQLLLAEKAINEMNAYADMKRRGQIMR